MNPSIRCLVNDSSRIAIAILVAGWLGLLVGLPGYATDFEWDGGSDPNDNSWGTQDNWNPETSIPSSSDRILLTASSPAGPHTIELNGNKYIAKIETDGMTGNYTFANSADRSLAIYGHTDALLTRAGGSLQFDTDLRFIQVNHAVVSFHVTSAGEPIVVNGNVSGFASSSGTTEMTLELTSENLSFEPRIQIAGVIADDNVGPQFKVVNLTAGNEEDAENHRGIVRVTGANTYTGQTVVNGAVLDFDSIGNVGSGPSALGNPSPIYATIRLGAVDGSSSALVSGTLRYRGSADGSTDRELVLQGGGGILDPEGPESSGEEEEDPVLGKLLWNGNVSALLGATSTLSLDGAHVDSGANEMNGIVSDGGGKVSLALTNTTTWRVTGLNTYTGSTTIERGTLEVSQLSNAGMPGNFGAPTGGDATINLATTSQTAILRYVGAGDSTNRPLNLGRFARFDSSGTGPLSFTASTFFASSTSSGTFDLRGDYLGTNTILSDIPDPSGAAQMSLFKAGATTWELGGNNTFEGDVSIANGTLSVSNDSNLGAGSAVTFLGGSSQDKKTLRITGNSFTGTSRTIKLLGGNTEARFDVEDPNHSFALTGTVQSSASDTLSKLGPGTLSYAAANAFAGDVDVQQGTMLIEQAVQGGVTVRSGATLGGNGQIADSVLVEAGGTVAPGSSVGTLVVGNATFAAGSKYAVEITGNTVGVDQIFAVAHINLSGALEVSLLAYTPQLGDGFPILSTFGSFSNDFEFFALPALDPGLAWSRSIFNMEYKLEIVSGTYLSADVDLDGDVDGRDFLLIQRYDPSMIAPWQNQYGSISSLRASHAVPEPGAGVMLVWFATANLGLVAGGWWRASRKRY